MTEFLLAVLAAASCVYTTSAVAKLRSTRAYLAFQAGLAETRLVPRQFLQATAAVIASLEALTAVSTAAAAILVATNQSLAAVVTLLALCLAIGLTCALAAGVTVVLNRGTQARCACFGSASSQLLGRPHLVRNAGLLVCLIAALAGLEADAGQATPGGAALAAVAGGIAGLLLIRFDELVDLFAPIARG